jgi:hypothetical protein
VVGLAAVGLVLWLVLGGKDESKTSVLPSPSGTLAPSPVSTGTVAPTTSPTTSPTAPPTTEPPPPPPGEAVTIGGHTQVPVPQGWQVLGSNEDAVEMADDKNDYFFARIEHGVDPSTDAAAAIGQVVNQLLAEGYSQVQTKDPQSFQPFGGLVSVARVEYTGIWSNQQGSFEVQGIIVLAIRQDGEALVQMVEGTPPIAFVDNEPLWQPVAVASMNSFAGV